MLLFVSAQRTKKEDKSSVKIQDICDINVTPLAERKRAAQRERAEAKRRKAEEENEIAGSYLDDFFATLTD